MIGWFSMTVGTFWRYFSSASCERAHGCRFCFSLPFKTWEELLVAENQGVLKVEDVMKDEHAKRQRITALKWEAKMFQ